MQYLTLALMLVGFFLSYEITTYFERKKKMVSGGKFHMFLMSTVFAFLILLMFQMGLMFDTFNVFGLPGLFMFLGIVLSVRIHWKETKEICTQVRTFIQNKTQMFVV